MIASFLAMLLPLLGTLGWLKSTTAKVIQRTESLESQFVQHRLNEDAHVTRALVQSVDKQFASLDARISGPTDREWGEHVTEMREIRHDLRNLTTIVRMIEEGKNANK